MHPVTLDAAFVAMLRGVVARQSLDEADRAAFARQYELVLVKDDTVADYLAELDALNAPDVDADLFGDGEIEKFAAEGLSWVPAGRLALLALDRGAVVGLHELAFEVWSGYWQARFADAEKQHGTWTDPAARLAKMRAALDAQFGTLVGSSPIPVVQTVRCEPALAFGGDGTNCESVTITVPGDQAVWFAHGPREIRVSLAWRPTDDGGGKLEVRAAGLPAITGTTSAMWLADAAFAVVATGTAAGVFAVPAGASPCYLLADDRSGSADVFYAAALDGQPLDAEAFARLRALGVTLAGR